MIRSARRTARESRWLKVLGTLNEYQARLFVADKALDQGRGGISHLSELTGMSRTTITKAVAELSGRKKLAVAEQGQIREAGGGRKKVEEADPGLPIQLGKILEETSAGDPMSALRWTNKSTEAMAAELTRQGHPVSDKTVARWRPKGKPQRVNVHDFPSLAEGKAIPYGAYEIDEDRAVVNVGVTHDTAEFAVESIRRWWKLAGRKRTQGVKRILICADAGGSNSSRSRTWKLHLQELADELGMAITVCHYPPGTSKWNKIEHRLFSFISLTWKGQPLINYETVVNLIGATKTKSGLRVKAVLDTNDYETGVKVTKSQMEALCIRQHKTHPDWNYTLETRA